MKFVDLPSLLVHVTQKEGSDFYRMLYHMLPDAPPHTLDSIEQWNTLPYLRKEDIIARPLRERVFIPLSDVDHLRPSSGTSGKGPLFSPRTYLRGMDYRLEYHDFKNPLLAYTVPAMPHWHEAFARTHGISVQSVVFDPQYPAASIKIAKDAGVDGMSLFAFHIPLVGEHMKQEGIAKRMRFIEICGESCTQRLFEYMRETFPNATILPFYGSSEVEDSPIGMPCRPITGDMPLSLYHGKESHYLELRDNTSGAVVDPVAGAEGELVITAYPGNPSSFPLIRFRTGDTVRVHETRCERHGIWSFSLLGRTEMDFVKVAGGVLRADEIERVLRLFPTLVSDRFSLHCYEQTTQHGPILAPVLHVEPRGTVDLVLLANEISKLLRLGPAFHYKDGVAQGRYAPLLCAPLQDLGPRKNKRIVLHDTSRDPV